MSAPPPDGPGAPTPRRSRAGPLALLLLGVVIGVALWAALELSLHLIGIAVSPLSWLLSLIGAIAGLISGGGS